MGAAFINGGWMMAWGTASWVCVDSMSDTGMESAVFPIHLSLWVKHLSRRGHRRQDRHCFHDNGNFPFLSDLCGIRTLSGNALVLQRMSLWETHVLSIMRCSIVLSNPLSHYSADRSAFWLSICVFSRSYCLGFTPISKVKAFTVCCFCQRWFWLWELQEESVSFFISPNRSRSVG